MLHVLLLVVSLLLGTPDSLLKEGGGFDPNGLTGSTTTDQGSGLDPLGGDSTTEARSGLDPLG